MQTSIVCVVASRREVVVETCEGRTQLALLIDRLQLGVPVWILWLALTLVLSSKLTATSEHLLLTVLSQVFIRQCRLVKDLQVETLWIVLLICDCCTALLGLLLRQVHMIGDWGCLIELIA